MKNLARKTGLALPKWAAYGAGLVSLTSTTLIQANIVTLSSNVGGVDYGTLGPGGGSVVGVVLSTSGGVGIGGFRQFNDYYGKTMSAPDGFQLAGVGIFAASESILSTFTGGLSVNPGFTGTGFLGFTDYLGNHGYIRYDLGGVGGRINYFGGFYGDAGEEIHVGQAVNEPTSLALSALGLLALGASGVRKLRKSRH